MYATPETISLLRQDQLREAAQSRLARLGRLARECCRTSANRLARVAGLMRPSSRRIPGAVR